MTLTPAAARPATDASTGARSRIGIILKPQALPDAEVAQRLEQELRRRGHTVFVDWRRTTGLAWAQAVHSQLAEAQLVVVLVSPASVESELLAYEVELVDEAARRQGGGATLLPVRLRLPGALPQPLAARLAPAEFLWDDDTGRFRRHLLLWESPADDAKVLDRVCRSLVGSNAVRRHPGAAGRRVVEPLHPLESLGGAMPLDSRYYIERPTDAEFLEALRRRDSLVLLKGARQMGKTSLLGRALHRAREGGSRVVQTDFQKMQGVDFQEVRRFFAALADLIAPQCDLEPPPPDYWQQPRSPNLLFENFWRRQVLEVSEAPVVWACDEFDRLFLSPFSGEVCGLLRSWHNARAMDPGDSWNRLSIALVYATETHLFIRDLNQSPFNVGTRLALQDFTLEEIAELNRRYGSPLSGEAELHHLQSMVGGQPYLIRCALQEMVRQGQGIALIDLLVTQDDSIFGDHLRRMLMALGRDPLLLAATRDFLHGRARLDQEAFHRLRSAGVVIGASVDQCTWRCELYGLFLRRHLGTGE